MDLPSYIRLVGVKNAAKIFEEKERTVLAWLYRERVPRPEAGRKIVEKSDGKVTFDGIYGTPQ